MNLTKNLIETMHAKPRRGALPQVHPCPYCGVSMNKSIMAKHRPMCQQRHQFKPPQAPGYSPANSSFAPITPPQPGTVGHPKPARLDQDAGGGYRPNGTYPQT